MALKLEGNHTMSTRRSLLIVHSSLFIALCAASAFATEYTWTGGGADHGWRTPANWSSSNSNKYPVSGDRIIFPANCVAEVELGATDNYEAVSQVQIQAGASVRFYPADPSATTHLDLKDKFEWSYDDITVEFDHIQIEGNKAVTLNTGANITVKNGSLWKVGAFNVSAASSVSVQGGAEITSSGALTANGTSGTVLSVNGASWTAGDFTFGGNTTNLLSNGATMSVGKFTIKTAPDSLLSINDSTFIARSDVFLGDTSPGGGHVVFKGTHPVFRITGNGYFKCNRKNADMTSHFDFDFDVPEGGFAEVPLQHQGSQAFRDSANVPNDYVRFNVLASSPAATAGTQTDCPLFFSLQKGIVRTKLTNGDASTATFRFTDVSGTTEATSDAEAFALYATIGSGEPAAPNPTSHGAISAYVPTAVDRHRIIATGYATALAGGGATTRVELWGGTANNAASMTYAETAFPTNLGAFSATYTAPEDIGEVTHYLQWRLFDIDGTGATNHAEVSAIFSAMTLDSTTYTWRDVNGNWDGDWTDSAHWATDYLPSNPYPNSANCTAKFPAGHPSVVTISQNATVGTIDMTENKNLADPANACGVEVTFQGEAETGTNRAITVTSLFNLKSGLGTVTLDRAAMVVQAGNIEPVGGKRLRITNGSDFRAWIKSNLSTSIKLHDGGIVEISGHSNANASQLFMSGNGTMLVIDDARLQLYSTSNYNVDTPGTAKVVFKGENPVFYAAADASAFQPASSGATIDMVFNVPAGGYSEPPIQCVSSMKSQLFFRNGKTSGIVTLSIDPESPFFSTVGTLDQPLAAWTASKTIDTLLLTYGDVEDSCTFLLGTGTAAGEYNFSKVASFSGNAQSLGVKLVSTAHDGVIDIATDAAAEITGFDPALGEITATVGDSVTLTAPADVTAGGFRYICTGYTLTEYEAGTADTPVGEPVAGNGATATFTMPAGGAGIVWHYIGAIAATAINDAGGVVAKSAEFATDSSSVTLTASTTTPGMEFQYWYGDVPYESRYSNPVSVTGDSAKNICAFFGATAANCATRLMTCGNVNQEWFDPSYWVGGVIPGTNDTAVLLANHKASSSYADGSRKGRIVAPSFVAVGNLVVSNAVLLVGAGTGSYAGSNSSSLSDDTPAQYLTDQNGNRAYRISRAYDESRTEPVGLDVFGSVLLDLNFPGNTGGNTGGAVFVGGTTASCNTRVNIAGDLDIANGVFEVVAGYDFKFVADPATAVNKGFIEFTDEQALFRGGNWLKVGGRTILRTPTATGVWNLLQVANEYRTGAAVWLDLHDVEVGEGAAITSYSGGYGVFKKDGSIAEGSTDGSYSTCPGGHGVVSSQYAGSSHGGLGGMASAKAGEYYGQITIYDTTYGYELTPVHPGNGTPAYSQCRGSGSIRLDCGTLDLNGGLLATGRTPYKPGAAGGAIFVICDKFNVGENAQIFADGGNGGGSGAGAGAGGGRIAICEGLSPAKVNALWATHEAPRHVGVKPLADKFGARVSVAGGTGVPGSFSPGEDGTAYYIYDDSPPPGTVFMVQ